MAYAAGWEVLTELTAARLRELLSYDPETGEFRWRKGYSSRSRITAGSVAGSPDTKGYIIITIGCLRYKAHRLAWLYMEGQWPKGNLDHINHEPSDNRRNNLREATYSGNRVNACVNSNNTSGFNNVFFNGRCPIRPWQARIQINGKLRYLGNFDTAAKAYATYCLAARRHFGEYARVYEADQLIIPRKVFERRVLLNLLAATQFEEAS